MMFYFINWLLLNMKVYVITELYLSDYTVMVPKVYTSFDEAVFYANESIDEWLDYCWMNDWKDLKKCDEPDNWIFMDREDWTLWITETVDMKIDEVELTVHDSTCYHIAKKICDYIDEWGEVPDSDELSGLLQTIIKNE